jgi:hypothetical protein
MLKIGNRDAGNAAGNFQEFKASNLRGILIDKVYTVMSYLTPLMIFKNGKWYSNEYCINHSMTSKKHYYNVVQPDTKMLSKKDFMEKLNG